MNLYLTILLMSLLPLSTLQHGAATGDPPIRMMVAEKRTDEQEMSTKAGASSNAEEHTKSTLQRFQVDALDFYRKLNISLPAVLKSFNSSYVNASEEYEDYDDEECAYRQNTIIKLITMILYSIVCIIGLFGNTLVIYVVLRFSKMQTVTNIYILNLAIADECFLIGIPFLLYTMHNGSWQFGDYVCKAYMVSTSITQFTSSIFLLIMSADRYIAVCHPISSPRYRTPTVSKMVSGIAWLTSALLMLPVILFANTVSNGEHISCNIKWPEAQKTQSGTTFILYSLALGFATPLTFIMGFYCLVIRKLHTVGPKHKSKEKKRSHRKVTKLVLTVITVYILCWLPYWISQVTLISSAPGKCISRLEITIFLLTSWLVYSNSAMNPILYAFLSDNFKKSFMKACTCAARKDVNAQLQMENSMFPRFNKSRTKDKLLAPNKGKQRKSFLGKTPRQRMVSSTATTTTGMTTCGTNMSTLEANSSVAPYACNPNNNLLAPPQATLPLASSCNSNHSNLLILPPSSVCTENSNVDNTSDSSETTAKPPVLHTDL